MKLLIIGARGQLGRDCQTALGADHELTCLDLPEIDITSIDAVRRWMRRMTPDAVVNCAAYTRVDEAERQPDLCHRVNADGPANLAACCTEHHALLIHISTDYVFDGRLPPGRAYTEDDRPNPLGVYGRTKLAGERPVLDCPLGAVLRTAWLYGAAGPNFPLTMLRLARREPRQPLRVVDDQWGTPTWSGRLARQIGRLLEDFQPGLYHATSQGACTWHAFATRVLACMEIPAEIIPIPTSAYPTPAPRPANSVLENRNLARAGLEVMIPWEADLEAFAALYRDEWLRRVQSA